MRHSVSIMNNTERDYLACDFENVSTSVTIHLDTSQVQ